MNELYLKDGTVLTGKRRYLYLKSKIKDFREVSKIIDAVFCECIRLNKIEYYDSLEASVRENGESLDIIRCDLEMLLLRLDVALK